MVCKDGCFRVEVIDYLTLECLKSLGEVFHLRRYLESRYSNALSNSETTPISKLITVITRDKIKTTANLFQQPRDSLRSPPAGTVEMAALVHLKKHVVALKFIMFGYASGVVFHE